LSDLRASGALAALLVMIATGHAAGLSPIRTPVVETNARVRIAALRRFETFPLPDRAVAPASDGAPPSDSDRGDDAQVETPATEERAEVNETAAPPTAEADDAKRDEEAAPATPGFEEKQGTLSSEGDVPEQEKEPTALAPEQQAKEIAPADVGNAIERMCSALESAAAAYGLPVEFFARVIWEESRFQPAAVGPVTRSGHRAQGIAQFMPYTAAERGLLDPFNPQAALPEAAEFLAELRSKFGNLGLAAAYNAGPARLRAFIDGLGGMPGQTRHYVRAITGRSIEHWVARGRKRRTARAA
jgi:Transglycosylase SLT domain